MIPADAAPIRGQSICTLFSREVERVGLKGRCEPIRRAVWITAYDGPSVVIYPEGVWYWVGSEADVTEIVERHVMKGEIVERLLMPDHPAPRFLPTVTP